MHPQTCRMCSAPFTVRQEDMALLQSLSPTVGGERMDLPLPTCCPECRSLLRYNMRNERKLYKSLCGYSKKNIVCNFSSDSPFTVYDRDIWWSDYWDETSYGRDIDWNRPFFEQLRELYVDVPQMALRNTNCENSQYTNYALNLKNCYLIFGGANAESCLYGKFVTGCANTMDTLSVADSEYCYEGISSSGMYGCAYFKSCNTCRNCLMIEECQSCHDCIACFGLRNKEYCYLNEYVGKERFEEIRQRYENPSAATLGELHAAFDVLKSTHPHVASHMYGCTNSTGDKITNCNETHYAFDSVDSDNAAYVYFCKSIDSMDNTFGAPLGVTQSYNTCSTLGGPGLICVFGCWYNEHLAYCISCYHSKHLFGCVGMKKREYCILNKQYSPEEYEKTVKRLIEHMRAHGEWGEYFPMNFSAFAYNETVAYEYHPLSREETLARGWRWKEDDTPRGIEQHYVIPPTIDAVEDTILEEVLACTQCRKPYRVIPQELAFYRLQKLPIPTRCHDCRHFDRLAKMPPRQLWDRACAHCGKTTPSIYAPDKPEIVYCTECYARTI